MTLLHRYCAAEGKKGKSLLTIPSISFGPDLHTGVQVAAAKRRRPRDAFSEKVHESKKSRKTKTDAPVSKFVVRREKEDTTEPPQAEADPPAEEALEEVKITPSTELTFTQDINNLGSQPSMILGLTSTTASRSVDLNLPAAGPPTDGPSAPEENGEQGEEGDGGEGSADMGEAALAGSPVSMEQGEDASDGLDADELARDVDLAFKEAQDPDSDPDDRPD